MTRAPDVRMPQRLRTFLLSLLAWTAVAALTSQVISVYMPLTGQGRPPWWGVFLWSLPPAMVWAVFTPLVLTMARRWRWDRTQPATFVCIHLGSLVLLHVLAALTSWLATPALRPGMPPTPLAAVLVDGIVFDAAGYLAMVAGVHALEFRSLYVRQRREALELRAELLEAQLLMLRMRLQPHFLFNALHAISELVYRNAALADRAITRLADLLRGTLASEVAEEVPLAAELEMADAYLDIERLRAGDALAVRWCVDDAARGLRVPTLVLQPLIENALRHGLRGRPRGVLEVGARLDAATLVLWVADDGAGPSPAHAEGRGLRTTRARLRGLYGEFQSLSLEPRETGGAIATVRLPARVRDAGGNS